MSATADYYRRYWSSEGYSPVEYTPDWKLRQLFREVVSGEHDTLDVGCGDGSKSGTWLAKHARSYAGVDVSDVAVGLARSRGLDAHLVTDASELPFAAAQYDVVVISEVLEHLFDPLAAAREARRVLRPGGHLLVTVPNIAHWRNRFDMALLGRWHPGGDDLAVREPWRDPHIRFFTPETMAALLRTAGFATTSTGAYEPDSLRGRAPGLRRLKRRRPQPRPVTSFTVRVAPSLFGSQVYAHARAPWPGSERRYV